MKRKQKTIYIEDRNWEWRNGCVEREADGLGSFPFYRKSSKQIVQNTEIKFVENKDNQILIIDSNKNYFPKLTCCVNTY